MSRRWVLIVALAASCRFGFDQEADQEADHPDGSLDGDDGGPVTVTPMIATVLAGETVQFAAPATMVDWHVAEGSAGGTIDGAGFYTSPYKSGTFHVVATSSSGVSASATITVGPSLTLFAGGAQGRGFADGPASTARFDRPYGVAVDSAGNLFVADTEHHVIRKISTAGVVTTLAGTPGTPGSADGLTSSFNYPRGVAVDGAGNVFVADTGNHTIREIDTTGVVTTFAGSAGAKGTVDAAGAAARFSSPAGVAVDAAGNLFVASIGDQTIRKLTSAGVVTTLAGMANVVGSADGTGTAATFKLPTAVAVDAMGNVYVADSNNNKIRKVTAAGVVTTFSGMAGVAGDVDGPVATASFNSPNGVAIDGAGNLWVINRNGSVRTITPTGVVSTVAGWPGMAGSDDGTGHSALFDGPLGVAADGLGNAYVADTFNDTIRKVTPAGVVTTVAGTAVGGYVDATGAAARFGLVGGVAMDTAGNVYVTDNPTIRKITADGVVTTFAGTHNVTGKTDATGAAASFSNPQGLAIDSAGNLYVGDASNHAIRKITPSGVVTTLAGGAGSGSADGTGSAAQFNNPTSVAVDGSGNVFVADTDNSTIRMVTPAGVVTTVAGLAASPGGADGTGAAARFKRPKGVATDGAGNVYVADNDNHTVRKIAPGGVVTTLAGTAVMPGTTDGFGPAARFIFPHGIAVDSSGNVFVGGLSDYVVRQITPAGVVTTIAGVGGQDDMILGPLPGGLSSIYGLAMAPSGELFVLSERSVLRLTR